MKTIKCSNFGLSCPFVAEGENEDEVIKKIIEHGNTAHAKEVAERGVTEEEIAMAARGFIEEK